MKKVVLLVAAVLCATLNSALGAGYSVVFHPNGATGQAVSQAFTCGQPQALKLNAFVRSGMAFIGWATVENGDCVYGNGEKVTDLAHANETADLYAQWRAVVTPADKEWETIRIDDDHVKIEAADKSRRSSAIATSLAGDVAIPVRIKDRQVVVIGNKAFSGCTKITSVVIPEGVTNIAEQAFYGCSSLTNVVFPSSLQTIGTHAFVGCSKLESVNFSCEKLDIGSEAFGVPPSVLSGVQCDGIKFAKFVCDSVTLGVRAFYDCDGIRTLSIRGAAAEIGENAFYSAGGLSNIELSAKTISIGDTAFSTCQALKKAVVEGPNTASIGVGAFNGCTKLESIELPEALQIVQTNTFLNCQSLQSVEFTTNLQVICYRAFDTCAGLKAVALNEGLREIEPQAFYGCLALESLLVPQSVGKIGARAFEACEGLLTLSFRRVDTNRYYATSVEVGERAFMQCAGLGSVSLPSSVRLIPARTFQDCISLSNLVLSAYVQGIGDSAFESCSSLAKVDLPASLESIGASAFYGCSSLDDFLIPTANVVTIGSRAFDKTKYMNDWDEVARGNLVVNNTYMLGFKGTVRKAVLPDGCAAIPVGMFEGMTNLVEVVLPSSLKSVGSRAFAGSGVVSLDFTGTKVSTIGLSAFEGCEDLEHCLLAETLGAIPGSAFKDCVSLSEIDIPKSVKAIGEYAFQNCVSLVTVTGGAGVESVGDSAFAGCDALEPFSFPDNVSYGQHVFQGVRWTEHVLLPEAGRLMDEYPDTYAAISSVVISSGRTNIVDSAFEGCASLTEVTIPSGVMGIGESAFRGCASLATVRLPDSLTSVATNAFVGCDKITSVVVPGAIPLRDLFPDAYQAISDIQLAKDTSELCASLFQDCVGLNDILIPKTVTSIGDYAFAGCVNLADAHNGIYIPEDVASIGSYAFMGCTKLKTVRYLGPRPTTGEKIYYHTAADLVSGVLRKNAASWADAKGKLPATWPAGDAARAIDWWISTNPIPYDNPTDGTRKVTFKFYHYNGTTSNDTIRIRVEDGQLVGAVFPEAPEREDYDFLGWFTKPYGGVEITEESTLPEELRESEKVYLYGHWVRNRLEYEDPQEYGDIAYNPKKAFAYNGYLVDGDAVVGSVQLKLAKSTVKRIDDEVVTNIATTATVLLLGEGKKVSLRGNCVVADGAGAGELVSTKKADEREMWISLDGGNVMTGDFDGYELIAFRDLFAEGTDLDKRLSRAALDNCGGPFAVVLSVSGSELYDGCNVVLSVSIGSKGKVKVSGTLPDGTKVSVSSQVLVGGQSYCIPVVAPLYAGKRGGFGFLMEFAAEDEEGVFVPGLSGVSPWWMGGGEDAEEATLEPVESGVGRPGNLSGEAMVSVAGDFEPAGVDVDSAFSPDGTAVEVVGGKWKLPKADVVKFSREDAIWYTPDGKDYGNPAGLKLTYAAKTGTFKGTFKVYGVTDEGKSKKLTATVTGAVVDGIGFGTATIKKVGAVPIVVQ